MAEHFTERNLQHKYNWSHSTKDNPKLIGFPDRALLSRNEGHEVLNFIQNFVNEQKWTGAEAVNGGQKVEKMIHKCPGTQRSHLHVRDWIIENWNKVA